MIGKCISNSDATMNNLDDSDVPPASSFCRDFIRGYCSRENCRYIHEIPPKSRLKELFRFCHDFQNKGCFRPSCKFTHSTVEDEELFYTTGIFPRDPRSPPGICQAFLHGACSSTDCNFIHPRDLPPNDVNCGRNIPNIFNRPPPNMREDESPPEAKLRKFAIEEPSLENQSYPPANLCQNCDVLEHKIKLLYDNISVLLNKVADLTEKNGQLTSMNEFLLQQTTSVREQSCVITSRHGTSAPVSLATVSVTPVVSLAGAIPALMPAAATPNLALAPAASRAQLLTPAPQILTVSTTQQLVGNSGALIVTSAGAQQLMQVSDSGTLMGGGQTVVAVTPAQLTLGPTQQLMTNASQNAVQQLVQTSALQPQLASQHQASQFAQQSVQHLTAAQQSAQHLAQQSAQHLAQQSAQHLAAQQSAQHLAAQQSAQHLAAAQQSAQQLAAAQQSAQQLAAAQQSAQQLAVQQSAQQQLVPSGQQLVHQTSTQQITISNTSQPMALPNSQAQPLTFPIISQSILPH